MDQTLQIKQLEERLKQLESQLQQSQGNMPAVSGESTPAAVRKPEPVEPPKSRPSQSAPSPQSKKQAPTHAASVRIQPAAGMPAIRPYAGTDREPDGPAVTKVLGFGGAASMILACIYLVRLAHDYGVFTPQRQLLAAFVSGGGLLLAGLWLQEKHRTMAAYLAATASVVLFLTVGAAYNVYHLLAKGPAIAAFSLLLGMSIWLDMYFRSAIFAFVAVVAAYFMPTAIPDLANGTSGVVIYYGACATAFSIYALISGSRNIYISAMYLGLVMLAWHTRSSDNWGALMGYQVIQFGIFAATAAFMSISKRKPMTNAESWAHAPALAIFYLVQIFTLKEHAPQAIPWVSAGSAVFLVMVFQVARSRFRFVSPGIQTIVVGYAAIALIHGVYFESVPDRYAPWVGLISGPVAMFLLRSLQRNKALFAPLLAISCIGFIYNNIRILFLTDGDVPAADVLRFIYALQLWAGFYLLRGETRLRPVQILALYAGHIQALAVCVAVLNDRLQVSLAWAVLSLTCLALGVVMKSKEIGRSALILLAAAGAKAAFYDLDDSQPVLRVGCLAVLGVSLFASGWLYTKLEART